MLHCTFHYDQNTYPVKQTFQKEWLVELMGEVYVDSCVNELERTWLILPSSGDGKLLLQQSIPAL